MSYEYIYIYTHVLLYPGTQQKLTIFVIASYGYYVSNYSVLCSYFVAVHSKDY